MAQKDKFFKKRGMDEAIKFLEKRHGKEVFVNRSLLRIYEDKLIVDDIYGEKVDFISEAHNFSQQLGLDLVIPVNMESRLSSNDIDYVVRNSSSNKETIEEKINGLIYSDAVPGKIKDRQINYSAFIIRRKVS